MSAAPGQLRISAQRSGDRLTVSVAGDINFERAPHLLEQCRQLLADRPGKVVINLSEVQYMDSSGVGTLVQIKRLVERGGGRLSLSQMQPRVRGVFEISNLQKFFDILESPPADERGDRSAG